MRYSRLLAWLILVFVVVSAGARLPRHAQPSGATRAHGLLAARGWETAGVQER